MLKPMIILLNFPAVEMTQWFLTYAFIPKMILMSGSIYQKSCNRREIFGLMIKYETPTLWITISPAGSHSPIFMHIADHPIDFAVEIPSHTQRAELFAKDPAAAAVYYNTVLDAFCNHLLDTNKIAEVFSDMFHHIME